MISFNVSHDVSGVPFLCAHFTNSTSGFLFSHWKHIFTCFHHWLHSVVKFLFSCCHSWFTNLHFDAICCFTLGVCLSDWWDLISRFGLFWILKRRERNIMFCFSWFTLKVFEVQRQIIFCFILFLEATQSIKLQLLSNFEKTSQTIFWSVSFVTLTILVSSLMQLWNELIQSNRFRQTIFSVAEPHVFMIWELGVFLNHTI